MTGRLRPLPLAAILILSPSAAPAQSSASYRVTEQVFNAGGRPLQGVFLASPSYGLGLESIGEAIAGPSLAGAYYRLDGGLPSGYPPPGEVDGLQFLDDRQTLTWYWEPASMDFNVYAGSLAMLPGGYGSCVDSHVGASWDDAAVPAPGSGLFFLVTGVNRILQEGTKGRDSSGVERGNLAPCP